ncbi:TPA: DUF4238 domain-containing protein [Pseudomonas aeruginosa]|uniref:DUF4238 domain-containing protein n=1 Tax=Pseudomonas aeruginosa TaxID=287 RepID=UPI0003B94396|nr:hypothetical protein Q038_00048 [Pseudomonas aeruginosa BWHPSA025]MCO1732250.1 DUF4238 domain-containing protein [Pseudomonas aeruginosa]MCO1746156.1 DUF4238 domain-containing protein [Pseudomonas aeruginosa]MCO3167480.1 DUF4238 domain-containing protein [Pseudomonas aeruginosa]MCO3890960.1 DUF4238 domain-containing protein [Pseudomonas aeruginosa]
MNLRKDNHYIPQLYLKQWATNGKIPTYRLLVPNENYPTWKTHSLKSICFHQHLYTYIATQGETDELERWLDREFESPAADAIDRVVRELPLTPKHWKNLVRFAVAQDVRTPARMKEFIKRQEDTLPDLLNDTVERSVRRLESAVRENRPLPQAKQLVIDDFPARVVVERQPDGSGRVRAETFIGRQMWLWNIKHILSSTLKRLPKHKWTILHAPRGCTWPTSDNPLIRLNYYGEGNYDFRGGWGVEDGEILLPLSPKHLLYTRMGRRPPYRGFELDAKSAQQVRRMIIDHADRYIFSLDESNIAEIRPRTVCTNTFKREQGVWRNWNRDQSAAELDLMRTTSNE